MGEGIIAFDAARLQLVKGTSLVEASAGTGKTYAIGMLVLRGIVELGLPIEKILIVTFTKAATEELRERIRARLVEARSLLLALENAPEGTNDFDTTLCDWGERITDREQALKRLQLALLDVDRASIFTIHGFCQRMLVDQALESGQLFDLELLTNIDHVVAEVVDDFWRNEIYNLEALPCSLLMSAFATPERLLETVSVAFSSIAPTEPAPLDKDEVVAALIANKKVLQNWWRKEGGNLYNTFVEAIEAKHFKKGVSGDFENWFGAVVRFIDGVGSPLPGEIIYLTYSGLLAELSGVKFKGDTKKEEYLEKWSLPSPEVEELLRLKDELVLAFRLGLVAKREEVSERLLAQGTMGFDGLIRNLARGLEGIKGRELCKVIGETYSLALIDEFQDTDELQYRIFSTLFGGDGHYLYLIGDPKQAIYKFRGADIHSYFSARNDAAYLLTLTKNYRSHPSLVEEVNRLFTSRTQPFGYEESVLDYNHVQAGLSPQSYDIGEGGSSLAGMVYCSLPENSDDKEGRWSSGKAAEKFCSFTVAEICSLLAPKRALSYVKNGETRPLAPRDIAILVRSHNHAEMYREKLVRAGVPAIVSSRDSVFHSRECLELIALLKAIAAPTELSELKSAMTISWFNLSGRELKNIWDDDEQLSDWQSKIITYHGLWQDQGLFFMVNRLLREEAVLVTLAGQALAERKIANIYQLVQLVQEKESEANLGMVQILSWLQRMYTQNSGAMGGELLLESDEDAVQIVTMHGAKGLEYPVVFCPYLWYGTDYLGRESYQVAVHEKGKNIVDLGSSHFEMRKKLARAEEQAEDIRLLYVALTRAKVRCYTMWADVKKHSNVVDSFDSALGYLLFPGGYLNHDDQNAFFEKLEGNPGLWHLLLELDSEAAGYRKGIENVKLAPLTPSDRSLHTDWQMSSFSALAKLSDYEYDHTPPTPSGGGEPVPLVGLPAGASFGNVIHDLLEQWPFYALASFREHAPELPAAITRNCQRYGVDATEDDIQRLLEGVVKTALPPGFALCDIDEENCLKEMAFYFQLNPFKTEDIYKVLKRDPTVLPVGPRTMRGYLTGFVDLICMWQGRYYIMDYKTNNLGNDLDSYSEDGLVHAMKSHNYGLQYWIYSLVLHRHLSNLLADYSYATHFGGVMYLFVRGMTPEKPGNGVYFTLPDPGMLEELGTVLGEGDDG